MSRLGVALITTAVIASRGIAAAFTAGGLWGMTEMVGASMALGGVVQMLSPQQPGLRMRESLDNKPSYAFGGPVNTTAQGNPVPVLYGTHEIGGTIISAGIYTESTVVSSARDGLNLKYFNHYLYIQISY
ncbi:hypothetical protein PTE_03663 [Photorhabdus khanii NC19]|uniref:Uncharacterized protein n=1 Tax=Photorhabdus khanii NC19 TaxID=1004151 RepID=W3V3A9_9GAMM|nr:hypothetical protein PTE_03663 [Photorhabdus khanii NC19]